MPVQALDSLRRSLLRGGVAPRYVRRYVAELSEHYEALEREELAAGFGRKQAALRARARLGDDANLQASVLSRRACMSFSRRHPVTCFVALPIAILLAGKALVAIGAAGAGLWLSGSARSQFSDGSGAVLAGFVHFAFRYAVPLAITFGYCVVAEWRGCRLIWPLAACLILAIYVGATALRIDTPLLQISQAQLGFGRHYFLLTPALLVPPAGFVCYLIIRSWISRRVRRLQS